MQYSTIRILIKNLFLTQVQITSDKTARFPDLAIDNKLQQPLNKLAEFLAERNERILFCIDSEGRREALLELLSTIQIQPIKYNSWNEFINNTELYGICIGLLEQGLFSENIIIIATPPAKRLSVKTFLHEYAPNIIREAIMSEIMRGGRSTFYIMMLKPSKKSPQLLVN